MNEFVLSLNETETLAAKAARGAGLGWGETEHLGRAARWLASRRLDWAGPLLGLLNSAAEREALKRLFAAADAALGSQPGFQASVGPCRPAWALAILATAARGATVVELRMPSVRFRLTPDDLASIESGAFDPTDAPATEILVETLSDTAPLPYRLEPMTRRSAVPATTMRHLEALAARTYVPASAQSRRLGAGGGRIDDP